MERSQPIIAAAAPESKEVGAENDDDQRNEAADNSNDEQRSEAADEIDDEADGGGQPAKAQEVVQPWDKVSQRIRTLQQQRAELKAAQKQATKAMKSAQRQKRRTARNAKKLSDEELVQIVMERKVQSEVAKQVKAAADAAAAAAAGGEPEAPPAKSARTKAKAA